MHTTIRFAVLLSLALLDPRSAAAQAPPKATPAQIALGDSVYHGKGNCYACHGATAEGSVGPNLKDAEWLHHDGSMDALVKQITVGITKEASKSGIPMPAKGGATITDDEVKAVAAYVYSRSHK